MSGLAFPPRSSSATKATWISLWILRCLFAGTSQAAGLQGIMEPPCSEVLGVRGWYQEPRLGEAEKPGPPTNLDNCEDDACDEGDFECMPVPGRRTGCLTPTTMHGVSDQQTEEPQKDSGREAVDDWLRKHAASEFVAVPNKTMTKRSRFEGAKLVWALKFGENGLGLYRDRGGSSWRYPSPRPSSRVRSFARACRQFRFPWLSSLARTTAYECCCSTPAVSFSPPPGCGHHSYHRCLQHHSNR